MAQVLQKRHLGVVCVCQCEGVHVCVLGLVMTVVGLDAVNTDTVSRDPPLNKHTLPVVSACDCSHCS